MIGLLCFVLAVLASPFKSKLRLETENAMLRHQLIVLRRRLHGRVRLTNHDRWFFIQLYRWFPSILKVLTIIRPETLVRWHRAGFRCYWRWKSCPLGGRPQIETKLRVLIRRMSVENPLWGAPGIHGELLKLGFEVAQSSVAKYMVKRRGRKIDQTAGFEIFDHAAVPVQKDQRLAGPPFDIVKPNSIHMEEAAGSRIVALRLLGKMTVDQRHRGQGSDRNRRSHRKGRRPFGATSSRDGGTQASDGIG